MEMCKQEGCGQTHLTIIYLFCVPPKVAKVLGKNADAKIARRSQSPAGRIRTYLTYIYIGHFGTVCGNAVMGDNYKNWVNVKMNAELNKNGF